MTTNDWLVALRAKRPCAEGLAWAVAENVTSFADAWTRLPRVDWMLWLAAAFEVRLDATLLRGFACECADRAVRSHAVSALRAAGLVSEADTLVGLAPIVDGPSARAAAEAASATARAAYWAAGAAAGAAGAAGAAEERWEADRLRAIFPDAGLGT